MSVTLESLSEELLDRILTFVKCLPYLALVVRASELFNRFALPHLYANTSFSTPQGP